MFSKILWYVIHCIVIGTCIVCLLLHIGLGIPMCLIGYLINTHFKERCIGFYYERRENFSVDVIDTDWELVKNVKKG